MITSLIKLLCPALFLRTNVAAATIGAAGIGAAGSAISSSNAASAQESAAANANSPWSAAQPYISGEYGGVQTALQNALGMGTNSAYNGERVAALNPYQTEGADQAANYALGNGANTANQLYNTGSSLTAAGANVGSNAQSLFNTATGSNPTQSFMNYGNQLANSSMANNMIDAANLDASRDLNETQLPSLAVNAANTGNNDSTRTGVAQALLESQTQQNMLANASTIQNNLFNEGSSMAQNQYNDNQQTALNANSQLGSAYQLGNSALLNGQAANSNNFSTLNSAGSLYQTQQQNVDNAAMNQFDQEQQNPLALYGTYMNDINGKYGGQAISSVGPSVAGSTIQGGLGSAMTGYGITNMLSGYGSSGSSAANSLGYSVPNLSSYYNGGGNTYGFSTS